MDVQHVGWVGESAHKEKGGNLLLIGIIVGVILGALVGGYRPDIGLAVRFLGDLFFHALMLMVVPLVACSMVTGIAALGDVRKLRGIGLRTIVYYTVTTAVAVLVGMIAVTAVRPGAGISPGEAFDGRWRQEGSALVLEGGALKRTDYDDRFRVAVTVTEGQKPVRYLAVIAKPSKERKLTATSIPIEGWQREDGKIVSAPPAEGAGLAVEAAPKRELEKKTVREVVEQVVLGMVPSNLLKAAAETQVLPIILFALAFGGVLTTLGKRGEHVIGLFDGANEAIMLMVQGVMYSAPVGIFALVAGRLGAAGGFEGFWPQLVQLTKYALTVVGGLALHSLVVLPVILFVVTRRSPLAYARGMATALTTAFSTASSSATLPLTLRGVEKNGVSERSASFVCPLGATINMDGTALYEAVAAIFIAQAYGIPLGVEKQIIIFFTATLAAIGAAGIPEAGLVTMVMVLTAVDLPVEGAGLILTIDWLLDRCRTTVNVWGDSVGAAVIDRLEGTDGAGAAASPPAPA